MEKSISKTKPLVLEPDSVDFSPIQIVDLELGRALPDLPRLVSTSGNRYRKVKILARLHEQPIGVVDLELGENGLVSQEVAEKVRDALHDDITRHMLYDGYPAPDHLDRFGLDHTSSPRCLQELDSFLENAPFASVVIATHNRTESLSETIASLLEMVYPRFEIIVVDNAPSSSQTAEFLLQTYGDANFIRYVREDYAGLSIAHNRGLAEVRAPYVAFTDDDVLVDRYWLANLIKGFTTTSQVGCITGMIFPYEIETAAQAWIEQYGGFNKGFLPRTFDLKEHRIDHPLYPFAAGWFGSGASMAFHTETLRDLGGFDPATGAGTLAMGGDDLCAFFDVVSSGSRLVYEPRAVLFHKHRREYAGLRRQAYGYGVGLTAFLTKTLLANPLRALAFAGRIPAGLAYLFGSKSNKNAKKQGDYPQELNRQELKGMLYGPLAYLRSHYRARLAGLYPAKPAEKIDHRSEVTPEHVTRQERS